MLIALEEYASTENISYLLRKLSTKGVAVGT